MKITMRWTQIILAALPLILGPILMWETAGRSAAVFSVGLILWGLWIGWQLRDERDEEDG